MAMSTTYNSKFWNAMRGQSAAFEEMDEGSDSAGGYYAPAQFTEKFENAMARENIFRRLATIVRTSFTSGKLICVASTGSAAWVPESVAIPEDADSFLQFAFHSFKLAAMSRIRENFVTDNNFNLEGYLQNEFARRFGKAEEQACICGDGVEQPTGILMNGEIGVTAASTESIDYAEVVKLFFSLKSEHRRDAVWLMHDETAMALRMLRDDTGGYLWREDADVLLGRPVLSTPYMPTVAAGAKTIAFCNLAYYWLIERQPLSIKRLSELYSLQGQVAFLGYERVDGRLIQPEAVQLLKMAE